MVMLELSLWPRCLSVLESKEVAAELVMGQSQ